LAEELARDPRVVVIGEDLGRKGGVFRATLGLQTEFGDLRILDTPISESAIAGVAIGAAMRGLRVFQKTGERILARASRVGVSTYPA
jgi:2-oxoisovalerate dehydrogenase E1 component beta subunit